MIDSYKKIPLKYQILAIVAITIALALTGWLKGHSNPFLVGSITAAVLILLHLFLTKLNSLLAFIVILVEIILYGAYIYGIYQYGMQAAQLLKVDINLLAIMVASFGLAMLGSYVYVGYRFSRGRLWLNLITAFFISSMAVAIILLVNPLFYIAALVVGYFTGLLYLFLRTPNLKKRPTVERLSLNSSTKKIVEDIFAESKLTFTFLNPVSPLAGGHYFAYNEYSAFLITVASPNKTFSLGRTGIVSDDTNLIPLLEYSQEQLKKENKSVNSDWVVPILLVVSNSKNLKPITSVSLSKWKQPDYILGVTNILTLQGFSRFIRATKGELKPLKAKRLHKISTFSKKLTTE